MSLSSFFLAVKWFPIFISNTNSSIYNQSFGCTQLNGFKYCYVTVTISHTSFVCIQFKCQTVVFDPLIGPFLVLPFCVRVDHGTMAMKGFSIFLKALGLKPYHQMV